jgi:hypothetical protein
MTNRELFRLTRPINGGKKASTEETGSDTKRNWPGSYLHDLFNRQALSESHHQMGGDAVRVAHRHPSEEHGVAQDCNGAVVGVVLLHHVDGLAQSLDLPREHAPVVLCKMRFSQLAPVL